MSEETILVHRIESEESVRERLREADIVFAADVMSQQKRLMYGRPLLRQIAGEIESYDAAVVYVELDHDTEELEFLAAALSVLKGLDIDHRDEW
jgi:hypothetical protein